MRVSLVIACLLASVTAASAEELANDSFSQGANVSYQGGFVTGEIGASRFVPPDATPRLLTSVQLLFGGSTSTETITLHVWDDSGGADAPGNELFVSDFDVTADNMTRQELAVTAASILVTGPFRVGIEVNHDGYPGIAADTDMTIAPDRNFIFTGGAWHKSSALGLAGDWIIRAEMQPFGSVADAGTDAAARDGAVRRDGGPDGGSCDGSTCKKDGGVDVAAGPAGPTGRQ